MFLNLVHSAERGKLQTECPTKLLPVGDKAGDAEMPDQERIAKGRSGPLDCNEQLQTSWQILPPLGLALHLEYIDDGGER